MRLQKLSEATKRILGIVKAGVDLKQNYIR
jgi:dynein heavy chain, axonemal